MALKPHIRIIIIEIICMLFVLLFVYAAVSKILDFENFKVQLGQSPLLSAFTLPVSWCVLLVEFMIAIFLLVSRFRLFALYATLALMTMFSVYIFIILHYSSFVPCSCGGILEKMGWNAHLIFNLTFILLSIWAIILLKSLKGKSTKRFVIVTEIKWISSVILTGISVVVILYVSSEEVMRHSNPFIRRYPHHPAEFSSTYKLQNSSYYIAGFVRGRVYLANYKFPAYLLSLDSTLWNQKLEKISFSPTGTPFKNIYIRILEPYFFLYDGSVPAVFRGETQNWRINTEFKELPYFTQLAPIDENSIAFRSNNSKNLANVLGIFNMNSSPKINFKRELLQKQIDGIFDTDGTLLFSESLKKMVYLYYYRNEFIVADQNGVLNYRGHTIDTISRAKIKVATLKEGKEITMSAPADVVNSNAAISNNLLFVHSLVRGKYEDEKLWRKSFIIDVYNLKDGAYLMSFPIYHTSGSSALNSFAVTDDYLTAVIGQDLVVYKLKDNLKKEIKKK